MTPCRTSAGWSGGPAGCTELKTAGRWTRLASELDAIDKQAANIIRRCREAEQAATGLLEQRDQLRGLLDAYRAKAGGLGAAENAELDQRYQQAKRPALDRPL